MPTSKGDATGAIDAASSRRWRYDGFISYCTAADKAFAPKIQDGLEQLAKPWGKRTALDIFQDTDDLAASPDLEAAFQELFTEAQTLVFLASPGAAASEWCNDEVTYWIRNRPPEQLVVVLTAGTLKFDKDAERPIVFDESSAAPPAFAELTAVPLYIDMTAERERTEELDFRSDSDFRAKLTKIAAAVHSNKSGEKVKPRDIDSRDLAEHRKTRRLKNTAITTLVVISLIAVLAAVVAELQRRSADDGRQIALSKQLAGQSVETSDEQLALGSLLSIEAYRTRQTPEALGSMISAASRSADVAAVLHGHDRPVRTVAFDRDGSLMASASLDGSIILRDGDSYDTMGSPVRLSSSDPATDPRFTSSPSIRRCPCWRPRPRTAWCTDGMSRTRRRSSSCRHCAPTSTIRGASSPSPSTRPALSWSPPADSRPTASGARTRPHPSSCTISSPVVNGCSARSPDASAASHSARRHRLPPLPAPTGRSRSGMWPRPARAPRSPMPTSAASRAWPSAPTEGSWRQPVGTALRRSGTSPPPRLPSAATPDTTESCAPVAFSPDGTMVASGDREGRVAIWDPETGFDIRPLSAPRRGGPRRGLPSGGRQLASAGADQTVIVWNVDAADRRSISTPLHGGRVRAVAYDPDRNTIITAGDNVVVVSADGATSPGIIWSGVPPDRSSDVAAVTSRIAAIAVDPTTGTLASGDARGNLTIWDPTTRVPNVIDPSELGCTAELDGGAIYSLAFHPTSSMLALGFQNGTIMLTDTVAGGHAGARCERADGIVWDVGFSPDGERLAATGGNGQVLLWELDSDERTRTVAAAETARSLAFDPSGDTLAVGGSEGDIVFMDVESTTVTGQPIQGHQDGVLDLAFRPDSSVLEGAVLASGGEDGAVRLWNAETRAELTDGLDADSLKVYSVAWLLDGSGLVSGGSSSARVWDLQPGSLRRTLCDAANRNLASFEWTSTSVSTVPTAAPARPSRREPERTDPHARPRAHDR